MPRDLGFLPGSLATLVLNVLLMYCALPSLWVVFEQIMSYYSMSTLHALNKLVQMLETI